MWFPRPHRADRSRYPAGPAFLAACLAIFIAACVDNSEPENFLRVEAGPDLMTYARVTIRLDDTLGNNQATLYDDSVPSLARLLRLPAGPYRGGAARITIEAYKGKLLVYREIRVYDGATQKVISVTITRDSDIVIPVVPDTGTVKPVKPVNHAPTFGSFPTDTLVSIKDSVPLTAEAVDVDGDLAGYAWDCNGDGKPEDSAALDGYRAKIRFGRAYADTGVRTCVLKIWDKTGLTATGKVKIHVVLDPPTAYAGDDTTVVVGTLIHMHANGEDGLGPIVSREWRIGSGEYKPMPWAETNMTAPDVPGDVVCILRITDSDALTALDTMVVHVVYSPDNSLSELKTSIGSLEPAFRKDVKAYILTVGAGDGLLTLWPKVNEPHAVFQILGSNLQPGEAGPLALKTGENFFTVQVTAQDGSTLQYSVTARR